MSTVLVPVEVDSGGVSVVSLETLTLARSVADTIDAVLFGTVGEPADDVLKQLGEYAVRTLHVTADDRLASYAAAGWAAAVVGLARTTNARAVVAAGTPRGSELLAHVATRLEVAMAANVTGVDEPATFTVTRQVMGGSALEETRLADDVAVFTVAGHALDPVPADAPVSTNVTPFSPELSDQDLVARVARIEEAEPDLSGALTSARVVVGAGRGVGSADGFKDVLELTELLGGVLGVSRVVTSLGWRPHHEQVGQTGTRVSPDLYLACGISGAIQHWSGMSSSKTIVAINTDPDAPMVTKAHYAVIGDLHEIVPAVVDEIRSRAAGR
jgi:electron transfer flavoprotein alpha subunit